MNNTEPAYNRHAFSTANQMLSVAQISGWDIPTPVIDALNICRTLAQVGIQVPPGLEDPLPTKPTALPAYLLKRARALQDDELLKAEAVRAQVPAVDAFYQATLAALPAWMDSLSGDFNAAWARFQQVAPMSPLSIEAGVIEPAEVQAYSDTLTEAAALDQIVSLRAELGKQVNEEGCEDDRFIGLVAIMPALPADPADFNAAWERWSAVSARGVPIHLTSKSQIERQNAPESQKVAWSDFTQGHHRWRRLLQLTGQGWTVKMARIGEVEQRIRDLNTWQNAANELNVTFGGTQTYLNKWREGQYAITATA